MLTKKKITPNKILPNSDNEVGKLIIVAREHNVNRRWPVYENKHPTQFIEKKKIWKNTRGNHYLVCSWYRRLPS